MLRKSLVIQLYLKIYWIAAFFTIHDILGRGGPIGGTLSFGQEGLGFEGHQAKHRHVC